MEVNTICKRKIKVLFINHATGWGGAAINMVNIINDLDKNVFETKVLLIKNSTVADKLKEYNIHYEVAESIFFKKYYHYFTHSEAGYTKWYQAYKFLKLSLFWFLSRFYFSKHELAKHDYDIVHLNSSALTDWLAPAKQRGKVIIHVQEPFRKGRLDILRSVFRSQMRKYADHIIAISKDNARRVNLPGKTTIVYNYAYFPKTEPSKYSYLSKKVLYLGGSAFIKGFYSMVYALDYLDDDVKVFFAGSYSSIEKKKNLQAKLKYVARRILKREKLAALKTMHNHPNVSVVGLTHNVNGYLQEVCCLVSPFSSPHFARPVFEAHFHKKPVIGSDVEGMDEIIEHEENGLIVAKDDPVALAEAINMITSDPVKAKQFGETGYKIAIKKFTTANIKQIEDLYCGLTD